MKAKFWAILVAGLGIVSMASAGGWHRSQGYGVADRWSSVACYDGSSGVGYYGGNCAGYGSTCAGYGYGGTCAGYGFGGSCAGFGDCGGWGHHHHDGDCCGYGDGIDSDFDDDCDD